MSVRSLFQSINAWAGDVAHMPAVCKALAWRSQHSKGNTHTPPSQWQPIQLLLGTEIAHFSLGPLSLSLYCDDHTLVPTATPQGKEALCLSNGSFIAGNFQITTFLQRLFLSWFCCACQKQTHQLVFKGGNEIKMNQNMSSPAWYLGFCTNGHPRPANRLVDLTARQELGTKRQLCKNQAWKLKSVS